MCLVISYAVISFCDYTQIMTSSRSLLVIINDVLDLTKIEAGQLTLSLTDFNIRQVILTCCDLHLEYNALIQAME